MVNSTGGEVQSTGQQGQTQPGTKANKILGTFKRAQEYIDMQQPHISLSRRITILLSSSYNKQANRRTVQRKSKWLYEWMPTLIYTWNPFQTFSCSQWTLNSRFVVAHRAQAMNGDQNGNGKMIEVEDPQKHWFDRSQRPLPPELLLIEALLKIMTK